MNVWNILKATGSEEKNTELNKIQLDKLTATTLAMVHAYAEVIWQTVTVDKFAFEFSPSIFNHLTRWQEINL